MLKDDPEAFVAAFASPAVYTAGGVSTPIQAVAEDADPWRGIDQELRQAFSLGLVLLAKAWVDISEFSSAPVWGDSFEQDGRVWDVEAAWREGDMWVIGLSHGTRETEIAIQAPSEVGDGTGFTEPDFATVATVRGMMRVVSGQEAEEQGTTLARTVHRVRIPAFPDLTTAHRLLVNGKTFGLTLVDDVLQRGLIMVLECVETAARESR